MTRRLFAAAVVSVAACSGAAAAVSLSEFQKPAQHPAWASPTPSTPSNWGQPLSDARRNTAGVKSSVQKLRHLVEQKAGDPTHPWWTLQLAILYAELEEDRIAFHTASAVLALRPGTPVNGRIRGLGSLGLIQKEARLLRARILARNGHKRQAMMELQASGASTGTDMLSAAQTLLLMGDATRAANFVQQAAPKGSGVHYTMRLLCLARASGNDRLVMSAASKAGPGQGNRGARKACSEIAKTFLASARSGKKATARKYRDGTFDGASFGFEGPVKVVVAVKGGRIESVRFTEQQESWPRSCIDVLPKRVVLHQGIGIDAVTGATVTSAAMIAAVDEALTKASR